MKLDKEWKDVVRRAWSVRLMVIAFVLTAAEFALPFFDGAVPRGWFALGGAIVTAGAFVARIVAQKGLDK